MRPVTYLHIGMNKAGSTSIQRALDSYCDDALEYLQMRGALTPANLLVLGYRDRPPRQFVAELVDLPAARANARRDFEALMARSERSAILSSEYLSDFPSVENAADVIETIGQHSDSIEVLSYLRPPRAYMRSGLQQLLKHNAPPDTLEQLWPAYKPRHARWHKAVAGKGRLTCIPFRRDQFAGGDLLTDFCGRVGADQDRLKSVARQNEGLSLEACAVLAIWQRARVAAEPEGAPRFDNEPLIKALQTFGTTLDWGFSSKTMEAIATPRHKDLEWAVKWTKCPDFAEEKNPAVEIDGVADLLAYSSELADALERWAMTVTPAARPAGPGVVAILDAVDAAMSGRMVGPVGLMSRARRMSGATLRRLGLRR